MVHLQLVRTDGREVAVRAAPRRVRSRELRLPGLDLAAYATMLASEDESNVLMRRDARVDARRFVRNLRARNPIAEARGMCVWNLVGDLLCHVVPIVRNVQEMARIADALRLVVGLVVDGEKLGAGMLVADVLVSIHGEGGTRGIVLGMSTDDCTLEMRFGIADGSFTRLGR